MLPLYSTSIIGGSTTAPASAPAAAAAAAAAIASAGRAPAWSRRRKIGARAGLLTWSSPGKKGAAKEEARKKEKRQG